VAVWLAVVEAAEQQMEIVIVVGMVMETVAAEEGKLEAAVERRGFLQLVELKYFVRTGSWLVAADSGRSSNRTTLSWRQLASLTAGMGSSFVVAVAGAIASEPDWHIVVDSDRKHFHLRIAVAVVDRIRRIQRQ
jgi:2-polyprenyl-6-methoxyphenol hydroxylase-like FAD-dependent oxidoreductase